MKISRKTWMEYVNRLSRTDEKAYKMIADYLAEHEIASDAGFDAFVNYMYSVVLKYSEGSSAIAAEAYDRLAQAQGKIAEAAVPAAPPTYNDVAKAAYGTRKNSMNPNSYAQASARLVKRTGLETMMNNASRDGAYWAWIPNGDTCPFCIMLASRGWQRAPSNAKEGNYDIHLHANCDCTYAVRFSNNLDIEGYDPDALYDQYINAGDNQAERLNALRRAHYEQNKDFINQQKRLAYRERLVSNNYTRDVGNDIILGEEVKRGVGAKSPTYPDVYHPFTGEKIEFVVGSRPIIPSDHTMAGRKCKTGRKIDDTELPGRWHMEEYTLPEWQKEKAIYEVYDEYGEIRQIELHWYQHPAVGKVEYKVKTRNGYVYIDEWY